MNVKNKRMNKYQSSVDLMRINSEGSESKSGEKNTKGQPSPILSQRARTFISTRNLGIANLNFFKETSP